LVSWTVPKGGARPEPVFRGPGGLPGSNHPGACTAVRLLQEINQKAVPLFALAAALSRDPSAVRRDVTLLESKHLVKTRRVSNPGHGVQTVVERAAASIELAATV